MKPRMLIVGDSFCSPNQQSYSWHNQLRENYNITNLGQNGVSQYKIHKQLLSASINDYDVVLLLLTSPYRIYVESNPFYRDHLTHADADLLYADILNKSPGIARNNIVWWFENVFDTEAAKFQQIATVNWDIKFLQNHNKAYHIISFFEPMKTDFHVDWLHDVWSMYPGQTNHLSEQGHNEAYKKLNKILKIGIV